MEAHLTEHHPEYAHPGKADGLPLPQDVYDAVALTALEELKFGIPPRSPFTSIYVMVASYLPSSYLIKCVYLI